MKTTSAIDIKGLEKTPENIWLLAETRSFRRLTYGVLEDLQRILYTLVRHPNDTGYSKKLHEGVDECKVLLKDYEHKLDKLYEILPAGCGDMEKLRYDCNICKERLVMVEKESIGILPETLLGTPSPQVAEVVKSKTSTEIPCGRPEGTSPTGSSVLLDSPGLGAQWEDSQKPHDASEEQLESSIQSTESEEVEGLSNFQLRVRHVLRVGRIKNMARDPTMYGRILGSSTNKFIRFCADSGTPAAFIPRSVAERNKLEIIPPDPDEARYASASGHSLTVIGQTFMYVKFKDMKNTKELRALVVAEEGQEVLVDLETLVHWGIIPDCFPLPMDENEREVSRVRNVQEVTPKKLVEVKERSGSWRTSIKFNQVTEEEYEAEHEMAVYKTLRNKLLKMYEDVFKENLEPSDRIDAPPVDIPLVPDAEEIPAYNAKVPIPTPRYLESAAQKELSRIIGSGALEEVAHATKWCCKAFFVQKPSPPGSEPSVRMVTNFKPVNKVVDTVGYPMDGSSHILKRLEAEDVCFGVIDLTQGYHQVAVSESSRDLLCVILPQGKYRFTCLPQGLNCSSDFFNILTDPQIRNQPGFKKNVDDVLTHAKDIKQLEARMKMLLNVCRSRNMKISPSKFQLGPKVTYGGVVLEAMKVVGDTRRTVFMSPTEEKLEAFINFPTPSCKKDIQSICGAAAQLKRWTPALMLESAALQKLCSPNVPFHWNEDLQGELDRMKEALRNHIRLSPLDTSKDLVLWCDAAPSEGMSYILGQFRDPEDESLGLNIISCDSTTFRRGKRGLSPFEAELACVHWALRKEDYFCRGARKILVCSDAKSLGGFINQDLEKIQSDRKQQMVEEMLPYRLEVRHVPGLQMELADHGSRYPISHGQHRWIEAQPGEIGIMVRSNRVQSTDIKDPKVEILAGIAARDNVYQNNVEHIENQDSLNVIHKASELKQLASDWSKLSVVSLDSGKLILRDNEILIPKEARAELVDQLHITHLSYRMMKDLAKGKFFWPGMASALDKKYKACEACKENSISHHDKPHQVIPENLQMLAAGEQISVDFAVFNNKDFMVVKDRVSGLIWARPTRDQTSQEAFKVIMEWSYRYGLPHECRSDGGGSFRNKFTELMKSVGINHIKTSPYNSKSNGGCERAVRSIKENLRKEGVKKMTQDILDKLTFNINNHPQAGDVGTAAERFFGRAPKSLLPNSLKRFVDHHKLIINRRDKQTQIALKKGRSTPNDYEVGDRCVVQDVISKRWNILGTIKEKRASEDGTFRSFIVEKDDGTEILRNSKFLKHQWKPDHITWADQQ